MEKRSINCNQIINDQENMAVDIGRNIEVILCSNYMYFPCDMKILAYENACIVDMG